MIQIQCQCSGSSDAGVCEAASEGGDVWLRGRFRKLQASDGLEMKLIKSQTPILNSNKTVI